METILYFLLTLIGIFLLDFILSKLGIEEHGTSTKTLKILVIVSVIVVTVIYIAMCVYYG